MKTIATIKEMNDWAKSHLLLGDSIGLVPTMGYLHEGHLSLVNKARHENDLVVTSIFVNPTQFGRNEDLSVYPRDPLGDSAKLEAAGVDVLFMPEADKLYGAGYETFVELERLPLPLCGKSRPGHFRGVATIVLKLFNIVQPQRAYFGNKDYQQLQVIKKMVRDLNVNTGIIGCPIVRETDGLAMSSRNSYLSTTERKQAICLYGALMVARRLFASGESDSKVYIQAMRDKVMAEPEAVVDYISLVDRETLENITIVSGDALAVLAVKIGKTRLIDNMLLAESASKNQ
ncbi:MAG: pantoate--beta-alanine ligase [Deltaproteobacteria bacterium]|nr:pantoate--beta-alanine ligase [Deltaproteobacteria bacterium]